MKILRLGDPHAKVGNLTEMKALILFVIELIKKYKVDRVEILGDLFHTHNVLRLEVLEFWNWALEVLPEACETFVIVGNHDLSGDHNSNFSALVLFDLMNRTNLRIIHTPMCYGEFGYVPYTHDTTNFIADAEVQANLGAKVLVCHQTIEGSKYDNGIYAPDGIPAGDWCKRFTHIISGHIHSEQEFGNIIYPGTARWDSASDANQRKGVWIYDHENGSGAIRDRNFLSTEHICSPIKCIEWKEGQPEPEAWPENVRMAVELIGTSVWVTQMKEKLKGKCAIKTKITDVKTTTVRKSGKNFEDFVKNLFVSTMDRDSLLKYAKELGIV